MPELSALAQVPKPPQVTVCPRCGKPHPGANSDRIAHCEGVLRPAPRIVVITHKGVTA
jgi:hypothetical protein